MTHHNFIISTLIFLLMRILVIDSSVPSNNGRPHIIVILADDMGWNDVSFHGADQIPTPNIDALAFNGVILNNYYTEALCTPSRAAFLSGKYPTTMGMQHYVLLEPEPRGLPLGIKLLPQYLREVGYRTHMIGKWHLGYYRREYTPTYRGFETFLGFYNGLKDYYSHLVESTEERWVGLDIRRNMSVDWESIGQYSTDLFTNEAVKLVENHNVSEPMFLYLAHMAVHSGNRYNPFQAPPDEIGKFSYIEDPQRRVYAAMVSRLDHGVGEVIAALSKKGMLENSIIIFKSDNGAPTLGLYNNKGSNYPLRGIKGGAFDGAVRGVSAVWSPRIKNPQRVSNNLMSVVDWLPTLCSVAECKNVENINGKNMWPTLTRDEPNPRTELLVNIDQIFDYVSVRQGDLKYVKGEASDYIDWYGDPGNEPINPKYNPESVLMSKAGKAFTAYVTEQQILGTLFAKSEDSQSSLKVLSSTAIMGLRKEATLTCNVVKEEEVYCNPYKAGCLFNITRDPCEMVDIAEENPELVKQLEELVFKYSLDAIPPSNVGDDPRANPAHWNNTWVSWESADPLGRSDLFVMNDMFPWYEVREKD